MNPGTIGAIAAAISVALVLSYLPRAGRKVVPHLQVPGRTEPHADLHERGWMFRDFVLRVDGREYRVKYQGGGVGEYVLVDGKEVARGVGLASLVPHHQFVLGNHQGLIELDVRWSMLIKGFRLSLDGVVLYGEGSLAA